MTFWDRRRTLCFERWRALKVRRRPVTEIYDDLTATVNRTVCEDHLYWRRLE